VQDFQDSLRQAHQQVRQAMGSSAKAEKTYFDRWVKKYSFFVGQKVWLYWPKPLVRQIHRKLTRLWTGPWTIITFRSPIVVELKDTASGRKQIVHVDRIVPCLNQETVTETEVEQMSPLPIQAVVDTQSHPSYLTEHQTSSGSQDVDPQSSYGLFGIRCDIAKFRQRYGGRAGCVQNVKKEQHRVRKWPNFIS